MSSYAPFVTAILSSLSTSAIILFVIYLMRSWLIERLRGSIKHEYDKKTLEIERQKEIRLKGEVVAELLAEWINSGHKLDYHQLNRMSFQAFIWLPKELADELSKTLNHQTGSKDVREIVREMRVHLQGFDDGFKSKDVIVFKEPDHRFSGSQSSQVTSEANVSPKPFR